jgi:hypothetical protein
MGRKVQFAHLSARLIARAEICAESADPRKFGSVVRYFDVTGAANGVVAAPAGEGNTP